MWESVLKMFSFLMESLCSGAYMEALSRFFKDKIARC